MIYPKIGYGRDSLVGMVLALKYMAESGKKLSEIVKQYPKYTMVRDKVGLTDRSQISKFLDDVSIFIKITIKTSLMELKFNLIKGGYM